MQAQGIMTPGGALSATVVRDLGELRARKAPWTWKLKNFLQHHRRHVPALVAMRVLGRLTGCVWVESCLRAVHVKANGERIDYGVVSRRVVTTAGAGYIVDAFQNLVEAENMKYHGCGTGAAAENSSDTALGTESTTALNPDSTRATGSQTENGSTVYRTVGTPTFDGSAAITEHGIFSQAATGGGTLLDRSVFSAINVVSGDSIQFTYDFTVTAGS